MAFRAMAFWGFGRRRDPQHELAKAGVALGTAIDKFDRDVTKAAARQARRKRKAQRRAGLPRTRRPGPDMRRPTRHRTALPQPLRSQTVPTVLSRRRRSDGALPAAAAIQARAQRVAATIRQRLQVVGNRLGRVTRRLGGRAR